MTGFVARANRAGAVTMAPAQVASDPVAGQRVAAMLDGTRPLGAPAHGGLLEEMTERRRSRETGPPRVRAGGGANL